MALNWTLVLGAVLALLVLGLVASMVAVKDPWWRMSAPLLIVPAGLASAAFLVAGTLALTL